MIESAIVYAGLILAGAGAIFVLKPIRRLGVRTRSRGFAIAVVGVGVAALGLFLPARESRVSRVTARLDAFTPAWQFHERHTLRIAAPPESAFDAIRRVTADEVRFFRTLTSIRRGGQALPPGILNPGGQPLIDVALRGGFVMLAEDAPRELVIGTVVMAPPGTRGTLTPEVFQRVLPPGFALAAMNFVVTPEDSGRSLISTETRVFANSPEAVRQFAVYWRIIYPGSAIIRRMWLDAIGRRATPRA